MSSSWIGKADKKMQEKRLRERAEWEQGLYEASKKLDELVNTHDYERCRVEVEFAGKGMKLRVTCDDEEVGQVTWRNGEYVVHSIIGREKRAAETKEGAQRLILNLADDMLQRRHEAQAARALQGRDDVGRYAHLRGS